mgnify:FL=1
MMKFVVLSSGFHRTYERKKGGYSERMDLCRFDYLVDNIGEGDGSNSRIET